MNFSAGKTLFFLIVNGIFLYFLILHQSDLSIKVSPWVPTLIVAIAIALLSLKRRLSIDRKLLFLFLMVFASVPLWLLQGLFIAQLDSQEILRFESVRGKQ